jgi:hypothetical protein
VLARACSVLVSAFAVSVFCLAVALPAGGRGPSAAKLASMDPGALHGGNTIVVSKRAAHVHGVPGRRNHMAALAAGATIHGGSGHDELGARAPRVTLRGRAGRDVIHGGRDGTLIGGPGADLLTATRSGATARAGPRDYVVLRGRGDRVVCRSGACGVVILRSPGTKVDPACRRGGARVRTDEVGSSRAPPARGAQQAVTGDGSNDNPFRAPCDAGGVDCTVSAFPERTLSGPWANEFVPAYQCPDDHPYVLDETYGPPFTTWGDGVEIREDQSDFRIGVSITGQFLVDSPYPNDVLGGTLTGFPNSSATNWLWGGTHWYKVVLHCTSNACHSTDLVGRPTGCRGNARPQLAQRGRASR